MTAQDPSALSYKDAGVDIDAGNALVQAIKGVAKRTQRPGVIGGLGGFGALFELPSGYREPVLVSGTDGVGTKLKLALQVDALDGIGIDLVAMCVNDLVVGGAEPLFFLDYYATGRLDVAAATRVVTGIGRGCEMAGCALVGGETAEMPGMYAGSDFDLAGFCVGIVEKADIIDGSRCRPGDVILGLASSGPHSNGYSLIRKILEREGATASTQLPSGAKLFDALLAPTRIYVKNLLALIKAEPVRALAHITGGGLLENIPRVLPEGVQAVIERAALPQVEVFDWLARAGRLADQERYRVLNCGVGMVVCVPAARADAARAQLQASGETVYTLGHLAEGDRDTVAIR